jgi:hypothetical protein
MNKQRGSSDEKRINSSSSTRRDSATIEVKKKRVFIGKDKKKLNIQDNAEDTDPNQNNDVANDSHTDDIELGGVMNKRILDLSEETIVPNKQVEKDVSVKSLENPINNIAISAEAESLNRVPENEERKIDQVDAIIVNNESTILNQDDILPEDRGRRAFSEGRRKNYGKDEESRQNIAEAVQFYKENKGTYCNGILVSFRSVAREYDLNKSVLERRVNGKVAIDASSGRKPIFTLTEEKLLVEHLLRMASIGYAYDRIQFLNFVNKFAELKQTNFVTNGLTFGWFSRLMIRNPILTIRKAQDLDSIRSKSLTLEGLKLYFDNLKTSVELVEQFSNSKIHPKDIWNMDEVGFNLNQSRGYIVTNKKSKLANVIKNGDQTHITVVACCNAAGQCLDPYFILKGVRERKIFVANVIKKDLDPKAISMSSSAYVNHGNFLEWSAFFIKFCKYDSNKWSLLILDGHTTHTANYDALKYLYDHKVLVLSLPPHSTHILQPLDVSVFHPLKVHFKRQQAQFTLEARRKVTQDDFPLVFANSWQEAMSITNIKNGNIYTF